jgi:hypothetical protein
MNQSVKRLRAGTLVLLLLALLLVEFTFIGAAGQR